MVVDASETPGRITAACAENQFIAAVLAEKWLKRREMWRIRRDSGSPTKKGLAFFE